MIRNLFFKLLSLVIFICPISCEKKFDTPPYKPVNDGAQLSINQLKQKVPMLGGYYKFNGGDTNLYCTLVSDETSGNFFKQVFVRDDVGGALQLNLTSSGGLYTGDRIRINLNNTYLIYANHMVYLDSVDTEKNVVKLSSGNLVTPKPASISDILKYNYDPLNPSGLQSQLVEINAAEFDTASRNKPFADAIGKTSYNRMLTNCAFQQLTVRTSGFANFASKLTSTGSGKIIGIVTQYSNTMQLNLRNYNDVQMVNSACTSATSTPNTSTFVLAVPVTSINEQFNSISSNSDFSQNGWINYNETGSVKWKGDVLMPNYKSIKATSFNSGNTANNIWLISPPIKYLSNLTFSFSSGFIYWDAGHVNALTAYVSTNFTGKNFNTANWTALSSFSYADGTGSQYTGPAGMKASGNISLSSINLLNGYSGNFCIAFRYSGTSIYNSTLYLDDISIK